MSESFLVPPQSLNSGWEPFDSQRRTGFPGFRAGLATRNGGRIPKHWTYSQPEFDHSRANVCAAVERQHGSDHEGRDVVPSPGGRPKPAEFSGSPSIRVTRTLSSS